jgi:hypothetical protein
MQTLIKVQPSAMEIDMNASGSTEARRCVTIMGRTALLDKDNCIPNPNQFMWI